MGEDHKAVAFIACCACPGVDSTFNTKREPFGIVSLMDGVYGVA